MTRPACPRTDELLAARAAGNQPPDSAAASEAAAHAADCRECADALLVASFLAGEAVAAASEAALPDPAVVLWRARRRDRARAAARALRPIAVWERLAGAVAAAATAVATASLVGGPGAAEPLAAAAGGIAGALPMVAVALLLAVAGGGVYLAWADE